MKSLLSRLGSAPVSRKHDTGHIILFLAPIDMRTKNARCSTMAILFDFRGAYILEIFLLLPSIRLECHYTSSNASFISHSRGLPLTSTTHAVLIASYRSNMRVLVCIESNVAVSIRISVTFYIRGLGTIISLGSLSFPTFLERVYSSSLGVVRPSSPLEGFGTKRRTPRKVWIISWFPFWAVPLTSSCRVEVPLLLSLFAVFSCTTTLQKGLYDAVRLQEESFVPCLFC